MKCIHVIGHGFECDMTYREWLTFEIQEDVLAERIALAMLRGDIPYGYNSEDDPEYFREFSINDRNELVKQMSLI